MKTLHTITLALLCGAALAVSCNEKEDSACTITVDRETVGNVAANNPGDEVIVVTTDAPYWIAQTPDWIKIDPVTAPGGGKSTIVTLTIASNYRNESTDTFPRSGEVRFSGGMTSTIVTVNQLGHEGVIDPDASIGGIPDEDEFMAFVEAVNNGDAIVRWLNEAGEVELLDDLDLAEIDDWTPIGNVESTGNGNNACKLTGNSFSGTFNGGGHTIKNFKAAATIPDGATWGLFGAIENAVVKNLNLEADVTLSAAATADAGVLVGTAYCSTIENVKVSGKLKSTGTATNSRRFAIGGIAGFAYSVYDAVEGVSRDVVIKDCEVTLSAEVSSGSNTANGATAAMYGGIVGFATNIKDDSRIRIENCTNNGTMTLSVGRGSGILATANYGTILKGCTNNADQVNTFVNGRIGNICSLLAAQSGLIDCVNNGNLTTTDASTTTGAFVALLNDNSTYIEGGSNTGTIVGANTKYLALVCANFSKFDHVSDVVVSGRIGAYKADGNHEMYGVTAENFLEYIGSVSAANLAKVTNLTYVAP